MNVPHNQLSTVPFNEIKTKIIKKRQCEYLKLHKAKIEMKLKKKLIYLVKNFLHKIKKNFRLNVIFINKKKESEMTSNPFFNSSIALEILNAYIVELPYTCIKYYLLTKKNLENMVIQIS